MSLRLCSRDIERCRQLSDALLSPLAFDDVDQWCIVVLRRLEALFGADRSMFILPVGERVGVHSETIPAGPLGAFRDAFSRVDAGLSRSPRADVQAGIAARRQADLRALAARVRQTARLDVYSHRTLARAAGVPVARIPWYNEVLVPAGVAHAGGMVASMPAGEAWLSVAHSRPASDRFGEANRLDLLQLVLPSFKAGTAALADANRLRRGAADAFDVLAYGCTARGLDGRELFRNDRFERMLDREPERERVLAVANWMANSLIRRRWPAKRTRSRAAAPPAFRKIRTARATYELRATYVAAGVFHRDEVVLVTLERRGGMDAQSAAIAARGVALGLTPREAEVLSWRARGLSYKAVAHELGISLDTVRTHVRNLYAKLHVGSHAAAVTRVIAEGDGPQP